MDTVGQIICGTLLAIGVIIPILLIRKAEIEYNKYFDTYRKYLDEKKLLIKEMQERRERLNNEENPKT